MSNTWGALGWGNGNWGNQSDISPAVTGLSVLGAPLDEVGQQQEEFGVRAAQAVGTLVGRLA